MREERCMKYEHLQLLNRVAPDLITQLNRRYLMLKEIEAHAPIGRRALSEKTGVTERLIRKEIDYLQSIDLVKVEQKGITLTHENSHLTEQLEAFLAPLSENETLGRQLRSIYNIAGFYVIAGDADANQSTKDGLAKVTADLLSRVLTDGAIVSVTGGSTMASLSDYLKPEMKDLLFVPARGGLGESNHFQANSIASALGEATGGMHRLLHAPDYLSESTLESLMHEPDVKEIIQLNQQSDFVIHGIGEAFTMASRRHTPEDEVEILKRNKAVTEAFGFYFDEHGNVVHRIKTVGIQIEDLAQKKQVFAVAGGTSKREAIETYLKIAPKNTVLITDEAVGEYLMKNRRP